ncbi:thioredoxin family protein [Shinella sp. DD12]|uniref:thioredoxin family protein n=1 Tax=Shinella sp. DD12 TaxID=1410620 RepID=UPI001FD9E95B|nr:thioredoxin family protein [Shinella sp. DD12]
MLVVAPVGLALASSAEIPGFADAAKAGSPILVHVTAPWCETCQAQKPIVTELLARPDFEGMKAFEIDFDSQKDILGALRVMSQSTMIVFKDGKEVDRQIGQTDPAVIEALLKEAL